MITIKNAKKTFSLNKKEIPVLRDIDLEIKEGEFVALMGPSGSGKSTLLGITAGIDTPTSGDIEIADVDIFDKSEDQLARFRNEYIGIVFQAYNLIPTLSALDNVQAPLFASKNKLSSKEIKAVSIDMLKKVGLEDRANHKPSELSGGEQQRVAIARALVTNPKILIADEPTGNLDSKTGRKILNLFKDIHTEMNLTMVIATHSTEVAKIADRIVHISDGKIV